MPSNSNSNPSPSKSSVAQVARLHFTQLTANVAGQFVKQEKCRYCDKNYIYHEKSTQKLKEHLMKHHKAEPGLVEAFEAFTKKSDSTNHDSLSKAEVFQLWASGWSSKGGSHVGIDNSEFRAAVKASMDTKIMPPNSHQLKEEQAKLADDLAEQVIVQLKCRGDSASVTIMSDGWTNVIHNKVTNLCLQANHTGYFWKSIVNHLTKNSAEYLFKEMEPIIQDLITAGVHVFGFVADNESTNKALFKLLHARFPFLIEIPCSAHSIQLVVNETLSKVPSTKGRVDEATSVIRDLTSNPTMRRLIKTRQLERDRTCKPIILRLPCATR
jgi:hypothetical protein